MTVVRIILVALLLLCPQAPRAAAGQAPLRVCAWVSYFPAWLLRGFTEETGISVQQTFAADNRTLYRHVTEKGALRRFDLITPSAELVQRMVAEELLRPLDERLVPRKSTVDPWFAGLGYDPDGRFSIPFYWGFIGLAVDSLVVPDAIARRITGYKDLWMPELSGLVLLPNDFRSLMSVMLLRLGYSVNESSPARLEEAMRALESLAPSVRAYNTVDQDEAMARINTGVGVVWSKEQYGRAGPQERYRFIFPAEGSPVWVDTLAVPINAPNPQYALRFINYLLRPDNLARLARETGYSLSVPAAQALLPEETRNNPVAYPPPEVRQKFEAELMLPADAEALEKRWNMLKLGLPPAGAP